MLTEKQKAIVVNRSKMLAQLELHVGLRLFIYRDTERNDTLGADAVWRHEWSGDNSVGAKVLLRW
jgi:hypothetical protein